MERARLNAKKRITLEADRLSLMVLVQSVRFLWFLTSFTRPPFPYPVPYPLSLGPASLPSRSSVPLSPRHVRRREAAPPRSPSSSVCRLPRCSTRPSAWSPPPACLATRLASLPPTPFIPPLVPLAPCRRGRSLRGTRLPAPSSPHSRRSSDRRPCGAEENGSEVRDGRNERQPKREDDVTSLTPPSGSSSRFTRSLTAGGAP